MTKNSAENTTNFRYSLLITFPAAVVATRGFRIIVIIYQISSLTSIDDIPYQWPSRCPDDWLKPIVRVVSAAGCRVKLPSGNLRGEMDLFK